MFSYCLNNPVLLEDSVGSIPSVCMYVAQTHAGCSTTVYGVNQAITVTVGPNTIYIDAYMTFSGCVDSSLLIAGIEKYWEGSYHIDGKTKKLYVNIIEGTNRNGLSIRVKSVDRAGRSYARIREGQWEATKATKVVITLRHPSGNPKDYAWSMAHEFGHCLGVGDYYTHAEKNEWWTDDSYVSIMNKIGDHATSTDVMKMLTAFCYNSYQEWDEWD